VALGSGKFGIRTNALRDRQQLITNFDAEIDMSVIGVLQFRSRVLNFIPHYPKIVVIRAKS